MTFNKAEYWKNRKAGKRGQGEYKPEIDHKSDDFKKHNLMGKGYGWMNRVQGRRNLRRMFVIVGKPKYPGDDGIRYIAHTRKGAPHTPPAPKRSFSPDPSKAGTNHERVVRRQQARAGA